MRLLFIGMMVLCWAYLGGSTSALSSQDTRTLTRSSQDTIALGEGSGVEIDESVSRPHVLPPPQWPEELRNAVQAFEIDAGRNGCTREKSLAFQRSGVFRVLASTWRCGYEQLFTLHRLKRGKLDLILRLEESYVTLVEPSGMDVFPDHVPAIFVDIGSGGSGYFGYQQHLFRVEDSGIKEVTPALRTAWMDMVGGTLVAMSSDDRWGNFFDTCGQCGPLIPVIQEWRNGAFRPACDAYPAFIKRRIAMRDEVIATQKKRGDGDGIIALGAQFEKVLLLLQMGRGKEGKALYKTTLGRLEHAGTDRQWLPIVQDAFTEVVMQAAELTDDPCPLTSAKGRGGHPGAKERAEFFRP